MIVTAMLVQNAWNYYLVDRHMIFLLQTFIIINLATYVLRKPKKNKEIVIGELSTYIRVKIIKETSAYLLNELLKAQIILVLNLA